MKRAIRRYAAACLVMTIFFSLLLAPGLPWSARFRYLVKKVMARAEMRASAWRGVPPKLISLSGEVASKRQGLRGVEVEALDSVSGWATLTDQQGRFVLPDVRWYPRANYSLIITASDYQVRQLKVSAPADYPETGVLNIGRLEFERGCKVESIDLPGKNSISFIKYERPDLSYYRGLFDELTEGKQTDEERLEAISRYVAAKFISGVKDEDAETTREVLEQGTRYCGKLALALTTIAAAGNYKTRIIDLLYAAPEPYTHVVAEVYYGGKWHLYDPVLGAAPPNRDGTAASYKELRLDKSLRFEASMPEHLPHPLNSQKDWVANLFQSGFHHFYYFD